jgi:hypothetical protein
MMGLRILYIKEVMPELDSSILYIVMSCKGKAIIMSLTSRYTQRMAADEAIAALIAEPKTNKNAKILI